MKGISKEHSFVGKINQERSRQLSDQMTNYLSTPKHTFLENKGHRDREKITQEQFQKSLLKEAASKSLSTYLEQYQIN